MFHALKKIIHDKGMSTAVGDEGGFAPSVENHEAAIQLILQAIDNGCTAGEQLPWAWTAPPASSFKDGMYVLRRRRRPAPDGPAVDRRARHLVRQIPIISIEDGMQ